MKNILIDLNNNYYLFKNNIDYTYTNFLQSSKISKKLVNIFFNNHNLTLI